MKSIKLNILAGVSCLAVGTFLCACSDTASTPEEAETCYLTGCAYLDGMAVKPDAKKGIALLERAGRAYHDKAIAKLLYYYRNQPTQNLEKIDYWVDREFEMSYLSREKMLKDSLARYAAVKSANSYAKMKEESKFIEHNLLELTKLALNRSEFPKDSKITSQVFFNDANNVYNNVAYYGSISESQFDGGVKGDVKPVNASLAIAICKLNKWGTNEDAKGAFDLLADALNRIHEANEEVKKSKDFIKQTAFERERDIASEHLLLAADKTGKFTELFRWALSSVNGIYLSPQGDSFQKVLKNLLNSGDIDGAIMLCSSYTNYKNTCDVAKAAAQKGEYVKAAKLMNEIDFNKVDKDFIKFLKECCVKVLKDSSKNADILMIYGDTFAPWGKSNGLLLDDEIKEYEAESKKKASLRDITSFCTYKYETLYAQAVENGSVDAAAMLARTYKRGGNYVKENPEKAIINAYKWKKAGGGDEAQAIIDDVFSRWYFNPSELKDLQKAGVGELDAYFTAANNYESGVALSKEINESLGNLRPQVHALLMKVQKSCFDVNADENSMRTQMDTLLAKFKAVEDKIKKLEANYKAFNDADTKLPKSNMSQKMQYDGFTRNEIKQFFEIAQDSFNTLLERKRASGMMTGTAYNSKAAQNSAAAQQQSKTSEADKAFVKTINALSAQVKAAANEFQKVSSEKSSYEAAKKALAMKQNTMPALRTKLDEAQKLICNSKGKVSDELLKNAQTVLTQCNSIYDTLIKRLAQYKTAGESVQDLKNMGKSIMSIFD